MKLNYFILLFFLILTSCKQVQKVSDVITNPSSKEIFEREIVANDSVYQHYQNIYLNAKQNGLRLELPSTLQSKSDTLNFKVLAYTVDLQRGERFKIESNMESDSLKLAIDLYMFENDSVVAKKPITSNEPQENYLELTVTQTGLYKLVILPYRTHNTSFGLKCFTEPPMAFPVSGKDNRAIQSFWGASRGGGSRSHKGIDIFAKRGTPVVAATDGFISNTGNRGLGGKQVWLRDGIFGQSLYYAHLDSITVSGGKRVRVGDTLGFVGNTGNARTTAPHLHFGIYTSNGAIDPLPFVKLNTPTDFKVESFLTYGETRLRKNELRIGAAVKTRKIQDLEPNTHVEILGKTDRWLHLRVNDSLQGFMHESLVKAIL
ncbi:M23 family metallopeptidase [Winogradskyella bathintestinalis]|uniref:M23 family metallopeptidase n=1 Tax=Winogradskyella bathintestinalis TaxID=3035208 RepID=A0ABT7ZU44_9FLAO|nr:M23 family metallopeptidase [Winogradskyella bathintestinalis]MDN3492493.1 M23 family metallopeptidase [Winogradskyella bathintestinalis]